MLTIRLLGPTSISLDERQPPLKRRKSRALLYYIAAMLQPVTRRQVAALIWGDHTDETARHNLRTTLYSLRQELGDHVRTEEEWIWLEDFDVDSRSFAAALEQPKNNDPEAALELYRGDFLADFDLPDSEEYENWITVEREHYRRLAIGGFQLVSRRHEAAGDHNGALATLSRALTLDPFQEDLQREGLRLAYFAGDRTGAIRRYEEFARLLQNEMDVQPMAETRALYQAIIGGTLATPVRAAIPLLASQAPIDLAPLPLVPAIRQRGFQATAPIGPPFTGRADELQRLNEYRATHQLVLVEGETGIGKTRLVETFISHLQTNPGDAPAPLVLMGSARQLESRLPYQPIIEALRTLASMPDWAALRQQINLPALWWQEIARLVPEMVEPAPVAGLRTPDESRLWEGVFQLLAALAQRQSLVLFIDDLHWADTATLGLLGYLVRQSAAAQWPITFLTASQSPQPGSELVILLQALQREGLLAQIHLERLDSDALMTLARWLSPTDSEALGGWLCRSSEGIPLFVTELVRYLRDEKILLPDGSLNLDRLPASPVVPPSIYTLLQSRLVALSDGARRVLDAAVAIGREFDFEVVARAAALSDTATLDALDELRQTRFITAIDERHFSFVHSLIMEVAYQEVGELRHRLLHKRVAAALESVHADRLDEEAGLIAEHYAEGNQPDLAAKYARLAGQRAMRLAAWKAAAGFFRQALAATPVADQAELLLALGIAQIQVGELTAAEESLRAALPMPATQRQPALLRGVLRSLGESLILQARYPAFMELAQSYTDHADASIRAAAQFMWGAALTQEGVNLDEAARHLTAAKEAAQNGTVPERQVAQADFELGNIAAQQGRLAEAVAYYKNVLAYTPLDDGPGNSLANISAKALNEQERDEALRSHTLALNNIAYHLMLMGDPRAGEYIEQAIALAQEKGMLSVNAYLFSTQGEIALAQEEFAAAANSFQRALAYAQRLNQPERIAGLTANLGLLALAQGQNEVAIQRLSSALIQADAIFTRFLAAQIRLWLAPLVDTVTARTLLREAHAIIDAGRYLRLQPQLERLETSLPAR